MTTLSDEQIRSHAVEAGFNLGPTANMLYTVRGNFAQLDNFARSVIASHEQARGQDLLALRKDAQRYRWLREQNWHDGPLTVVRSPREAVRLGYDCPSLSRLDEFIDEFRAALAGAGESK